MANDQGTRGLPASDGPLKGFLGGARRCAERATNLPAGQSGGSPSGELGRLQGVIARLETKSASFEGMWRRVLEFANKADCKATRQDRRVEFMLTRSIQRMLENDKLQHAPSAPSGNKVLDGTLPRRPLKRRVRAGSAALAVSVVSLGETVTSWFVPHPIPGAGAVPSGFALARFAFCATFAPKSVPSGLKIY